MPGPDTRSHGDAYGSSGLDFASIGQSVRDGLTLNRRRTGIEVAKCGGHGPHTQGQV